MRRIPAAMRALRSLSLLAILTVSATHQSGPPPLSRIRVVTATEDARSAAGAIPHPDRSVPDAQVSPRVENWLSQYRDEISKCYPAPFPLFQWDFAQHDSITVS